MNKCPKEDAFGPLYVTILRLKLVWKANCIPSTREGALPLSQARLGELFKSSGYFVKLSVDPGSSLATGHEVQTAHSLIPPTLPKLLNVRSG